MTHGHPLIAPLMVAPGLLYAYAGYKDLNSHKNLPRNFPVAVRIRYLLEGIRPEIRQYFIESDTEANPLSREWRTLVYSRAKLQGEAGAFGEHY